MHNFFQHTNQTLTTRQTMTAQTLWNTFTHSITYTHTHTNIYEPTNGSQNSTGPKKTPFKCKMEFMAQPNQDSNIDWKWRCPKTKKKIGLEFRMGNGNGEYSSQTITPLSLNYLQSAHLHSVPIPYFSLWIVFFFKLL